MARIIRFIRHVLLAASRFPPHRLATPRNILHRSLQKRLQHGSPVGRHGRWGNVVQNRIAKRLLLRRYATRRLVHRHRLHQLGHRATIHIKRDDSPRHEQRRRHLYRKREPRAEFLFPDWSASGGSDARVGKLSGDGRHDGDERSVCFLWLPGWYVQHELPGSWSD